MFKIIKRTLCNVLKFLSWVFLMLISILLALKLGLSVRHEGFLYRDMLSVSKKWTHKFQRGMCDSKLAKISENKNLSYTNYFYSKCYTCSLSYDWTYHSWKRLTFTGKTWASIGGSIIPPAVIENSKFKPFAFFCFPSKGVHSTYGTQYLLCYGPSPRIRFQLGPRCQTYKLK